MWHEFDIEICICHQCLHFCFAFHTCVCVCERVYVCVSFLCMCKIFTRTKRARRCQLELGRGCRQGAWRISFEVCQHGA